jgi:hypothetical protein
MQREARSALMQWAVEKMRHDIIRALREAA